MMKRPKALLFSLLLFLGSCTQYYVTTNAFADPEVIPGGFESGASFAIVSTHQNDKLFSKEVSHKIGKLLTSQGYVVRDSLDADYILSFDFGMESFTETVQVKKTIPGEKVKKHGNVKVHGDKHSNKSYEEETESSTQVIYVPEERTYYSKKLSIFVCPRDAAQKDDVWNVTTSCSGSNNDLREIVDYLLVSSFRHFGHNTHKKIVTAFDKDADEIKNLRQ